MKFDSTQDFIGKIKQIEMNTFRYSTNKKDTTVHKSKSILYYDQKNRIIKQIDYYSKFTDETDFYYNNNLLDSTISKNEKYRSKEVYKYDKKNNIIEYNQIENDTLFFRKTSVYDKHKNPTTEIYFFPNSKKIKSKFEKYTYDYKNRVFTIQSFDENDKPKDHYLKINFNKKGFVIKSEFIYTNSKKGNSETVLKEYDNKGNLTKNISLDNNGNPRETKEYKFTYDEKGNIIKKEMYWNQQLKGKSLYNITYR